MHSSRCRSVQFPRWRRQLLAWIGGLLFAAAGNAEPTIEERLRALENRLQAITRENTELKEALGWRPTSPPVVAHPAGAETRLLVGGFLQFQAEFGHAADPRFVNITDRFFFRRARIYVAGSFAEPFDFKAELDLGANSLNSANGIRAQANEIYIHWHRFAGFNLRAGQLKAAYGSENLASDTTMLTIERSLANDRLADGRQLAVSASGTLFGERLTYLTVVGNGVGANSSANDNSRFQRSARIAFRPFAARPSGALGRLEIGTGGLWSEDNRVAKPGFAFTQSGNSIDNLFVGRRTAWGIDARWKSSRLDFSGEWLEERFHPSNRSPAADLVAHGWHLTAAYTVLPDKWQVVLRRENFDPGSAAGGNAANLWTLGQNWLIYGDNLKLMVNYLIGKAPGTSESSGRLLARFQVIF